MSSKAEPQFVDLVCEGGGVIKTLGVGTTDFELPKERALQLYEADRTCLTEPELNYETMKP